MGDLIDRDALKDSIKHAIGIKSFRYLLPSEKVIVFLVNEAPAVDAVPVRRGRWIPHITEDGYKSGYDCSVCGVWIVMPNGLRKYCCDCGALMDGGETE